MHAPARGVGRDQLLFLRAPTDEDVFRLLAEQTPSEVSAKYHRRIVHR